MGILWRLTKTGIRVGLVVGAVKISIDSDVWSLRTAKGAHVYDQLQKYVLPGTIVYKEKLPSSEEVHVNVGSKWNEYVNCFFTFLNAAPAKLNTGVNSLYRSAADEIQAITSGKAS